METQNLCKQIGINSNIIDKIEKISPLWVREHEPDIYWIKFFVLNNVDDEFECCQLLQEEKIQIIGFTKESSTRFCNWIQYINSIDEQFIESQLPSYWIEMYIDEKYNDYMKE